MTSKTKISLFVDAALILLGIILRVEPRKMIFIALFFLIDKPAKILGDKGIELLRKNETSLYIPIAYLIGLIGCIAAKFAILIYAL